MGSFWITPTNRFIRREKLYNIYVGIGFDITDLYNIYDDIRRDQNMYKLLIEEAYFLFCDGFKGYHPAS